MARSAVARQADRNPHEGRQERGGHEQPEEGAHDAPVVLGFLGGILRLAWALADVVDHGARFYRLPVLRGTGSPRDERAANR